MPQFQLPGRPGSRLSPFQIIILGFAGIILTGALLLMTPFAAAGGRCASFSDALFTSVSAVCVTGLVVCDTATCWSAFGQAVILGLIQIGGLGVVTAAASLVSPALSRLCWYTFLFSRTERLGIIGQLLWFPPAISPKWVK